MIERKAAKVLKRLAKQWPVVTVQGPRQSGKTTLAKTLFPGHAYANLELPSVRELALRDPEAFFREYPAPAVYDEIQRVPDLLSYIQVRVDENPGNGQFILTGSHQPALRSQVAQSLAGRTALLTLLPLSLEELSEAGLEIPPEEAIAKGFMPRVHAGGIPAGDFYEDYYRTYVERDVRQLVEVADQTAFETFVRLLAARVGQLAHLQNMAGEVGASAPTLRKWLSVLEASFIVFRLQPYFANFGKRLVKTPKIYFTDTGLAAHLLGIETGEQAMRDPLAGGLFENLVVAEALKWKANGKRREGFWFFRDSNGLEVDLIVEKARKLHLLEIKSAMTPAEAMARNLRKFASLDGVAVLSETVVYRGRDFPIAGGGAFVNAAGTASRLDALCGK